MRTNITSDEKIDFSEIQVIYSLFESKKWHIDDANESSLLNRFINLYKSCDEKERTLLIKLSYDFQVIELETYTEMLIKLLERAVTEYDKSKSKVYIRPIKQESHSSFIKSSDFVSYLCKSTKVCYNKTLANKKFEIIGSHDSLKKKSKKFHARHLFIIDDFIGTGQYVSDTIDEIVNLGIDIQNIIVLTLYIHKIGLKKLSDKGVKVKYIEIIDDELLKKLTATEISILQGMAKKFNVDENFELGYKQSGALISLVRTPNNTLPFFWHPSNAPFRR